MKKGIGIYIGQKEVIVASISLLKGVPDLVRFAIEPVVVEAGASPSAKKGPTPESQAVERALQKAEARNTEVVAAFSPLHVVTRSFEMPYIPRKEWQNAACFEASRHIPFKLSETVSDFYITEQDGEKKGKQLAVTVAAVKLETFVTYVQYLRRGSAKVAVIEPIFSAFSRTVSRSEELQKGKIYGFIFLDQEGAVNVTFARSGHAYLSRDFLLSENRTTNETRFYQELKASFDFLQMKTGGMQVEKIFMTGAGDLTSWSEYLAGVFGKDTRFERARFQTKQAGAEQAMGMLVVPIGLALRALKIESPLGNLSLHLPAGYEVRTERIKKILQRDILIIVGLFFFIRFVILWPYMHHLERLASNPLSNQGANDPRFIGSSIADLGQLKGNLESQMRELTLIQKRKTALSSKFKALAQSIPPTVWISQVAYQDLSRQIQVAGEERMNQASISTGGTKEFRLEGFCYIGDPEAEVQTINSWVEALSENKALLQGLSSVTLDEVVRDQYGGRGVTRFRIVCR